MSELTLTSGTAAPVTPVEDPYVLTDADGNITRRPVEALSSADRENARPYPDPEKHPKAISSVCKQIADWFVSFTGTRQTTRGLTVRNSLRSFAWLTTMKGFFPTKGSSLLSFLWEEDAEGNKSPVGEPLGYRMWTVVPSDKSDLSVPENVEAFNNGRQLSIKIVPVSSAIGLTTAEIEPSETYDVPRLTYRNVVLVDFDVEADGTVIPKLVRANYYLRLQHKNRNWSMPYTKGNGELGTQQATIFSGCTERHMVDVTVDFVDVYNQVAEANPEFDVNQLVHKTLEQFFANDQLKEKRLSRFLQLQARAIFGAHVAALPGGQGSLKYDNDLVDRVCLYATETYEHYHGVERTIEGRDADDEFVDYYCRLVKLEDPLVLNAQRLSGRTRLNDGVSIVMMQ